VELASLLIVVVSAIAGLAAGPIVGPKLRRWLLWLGAVTLISGFGVLELAAYGIAYPFGAATGLVSLPLLGVGILVLPFALASWTRS